MTTGAVPSQTNEQARQAEVDRLAVDTFEETAYDDIARLASELCQTPVSLVTIVDGDRQWFKARVGTDVTETLARRSPSAPTPSRRRAR